MVRSAYEAHQDTPVYHNNTSDEEDTEQVELTPQQTPLATPLEPTKIISTTPTPTPSSSYICSNFIPNDDNTIFQKDYAIIALKANQNLIIKGQFNLEIQRGAILINNVIYHSSHDSINFINPSSHSIPLIQATQVTDRSKTNDTITKENEHLFSSNYKSVIKINNLFTGLQDLNIICPNLKNLFFNSQNLSKDELKQFDDFELLFLDYSFIPILKPDNTSSIINYKNWIKDIIKLRDLYSQGSLLKIMIIGSKNCGKSTLLKLILQNFLSISTDSVNVLDLDPGQPEFSKPESISLTKLNTLGSFHNPDLVKNHYIGFQSPKDQPKRYDVLVSDLISTYNNDGLIKNESLLINTPGWIKGYGVNLNQSLINQINPTHLIYLNNGNLTEIEDFKISNLENVEILPILGNFTTNSTSKYSNSMLRIFKKLSYFHKFNTFQYDFNPLILKSPLQLSYGSGFLKSVTFANIDDLNFKDLKNSLEATIVALYSIDLTNIDPKIFQNTNSIPFIANDKFMEIDNSLLNFKSLALIHSIDLKRKVFNLYIPSFELQNLKEDNFIIFRGKSETPIWELASREIYKNFDKEKLPFITFDKISEYDNLKKNRKTIQRRGNST